jgi:hypothetical protein
MWRRTVHDPRAPVDRRATVTASSYEFEARTMTRLVRRGVELHLPRGRPPYRSQVGGASRAAAFAFHTPMCRAPVQRAT